MRQFKRSFYLIFLAGLALIFQYLVWNASWGSVFSSIIFITFAGISFVFGLCFVMQLGGNLISSKLGELGAPSDQGETSRIAYVCILIAVALTAMACLESTALLLCDLLLGVGVCIRLLQWNVFEPNGLEEFEPAKP